MLRPFRSLRTLLLTVVPLSLCLSAASAYADSEPPGPEKRLPVAEAERPLTLPKLVLSADATFTYLNLSNSPAAGSEGFANLSIGAAIGITDNLTVRATILPLQLAAPNGQGFHYGQTTFILAGLGDPGPGIGLTYRLLSGVVELGLSLDGSIITIQSFSGGVFTPGIPLRAHFGKVARLDTGAYLDITEASLSNGIGGGGSTSNNQNGLTIPVSLLVDIIEPLHVGVATGYGITDLSRAGDTSYIPLGFFAGYAIAGSNGPVFDIEPFFNFPLLATPGITGNTTQTGTYTVGANLTGFFYL